MLVSTTEPSDRQGTDEAHICAPKIMGAKVRPYAANAQIAHRAIDTERCRLSLRTPVWRGTRDEVQQCLGIGHRTPHALPVTQPNVNVSERNRLCVRRHE